MAAKGYTNVLSRQFRQSTPSGNRLAKWKLGPRGRMIRLHVLPTIIVARAYEAYAGCNVDLYLRQFLTR